MNYGVYISGRKIIFFLSKKKENLMSQDWDCFKLFNMKLQ